MSLDAGLLETDVAVMGAGPGGYAAAFRAADLGLNVMLIDPEPNPGGVCLHRGCIPSKALLYTAALIEEAREAAGRGVCFGEPAIDLDQLRGWKDDVVGKLTTGLGLLCRSRGISYVRGRGVLCDAHSLELQTDQAPRTRLRFGSCIIATGSRPVTPANLALESTRVMTSTGALVLDEIPARLLVVGGGYIGMELATVYAALGSRVTVIEMTPTLLPAIDRDLVRVLVKRLEARLDAILLETKVASLAAQEGAVCVRLEGKAAQGQDDREFDRVLVAVGRAPNSSGLGLATTRVEIDERGFIRTDEGCRTAEPSIFAIGDVAGEPMLAHKATHEGLVAAECAAGHARVFEPAAIPAVVFTDPEIAYCGLTESAAKERGRSIEVGRFPWSASGRALTLGRTDGLSKIIADPETHRVLGAGVVGHGAGELIAEAAHAIEMGATAEDLALTVHPHPTLGETLMEAAEGIYGRSLHVHKRRKRP